MSKKRGRGRPKGFVMPESSKEKISKALKGRVLSEIHKQRISKAMKLNLNGLSKKINKKDWIQGISSSVEYYTYKNMLKRCYDKNCKAYQTYGKRGIEVCARWLCDRGFLNFYYDMGPRPNKKFSIDRRNNDGNYCKENCRWATRFEQQDNTRAVKKFIAINKKRNLKINTWNMAKFARMWNLNKRCIGLCLCGKQKSHKGWTFEELENNN